jgi:hypothetical protein
MITNGRHQGAYVTFLVVAALLFSLPYPAQAARATASASSGGADIVVQSASTGALAGAVSAGLVACWITDDDVWRTVILPRLINSPPSNIRLCSPVWPAFNSMTAPTPGDASYLAAQQSILAVLQIIQPLVNRGWTVSVDIATVPRWLSNDPTNQSTPPARSDMYAWSSSPPAPDKTNDWVNLVKWLVGVYASAGVHPWYGVGNEPDWTFISTEAEYLDHYDRTAHAVREADALAHVGGPNASGFSANKVVYLSQPDANGHWQVDVTATSANGPLVMSLIKHVGQSGAPLDFVDYHFVDEVTLNGTATQTQAALAAAGLSASLPIRIGEWTYRPESIAASDEDSAAFILAMFQAMADTAGALGAPFVHNHTGLYDQSGWTNTISWSYVGTVSSTNSFARPWGVVRPKLNAYDIIGRLGGGFSENNYQGADRLPVTFPDLPFLHGVAARRTDGSIAVAIANYVPTDITGYTTRRINQQLLAQGVLTQAQIRQVVAALSSDTCKKKVAAAGLSVTWTTLSDPQFVNQLLALCTTLTPAQRSSTAPIVAGTVADMQRWQTQPWAGTIGVPIQTSAKVTAYRIDGNHANACGYNRRTAPPSSVTQSQPCGVGGTIDQMNSQILTTGTTSMQQTLTSRGWTSAQITLVNAAVNSCQAQTQFNACVLNTLAPNGVPNPALPPTYQADLGAAETAALQAMATTELAFRSNLNSQSDVVLTPEQLSDMAAGQPVPIQLPPGGSILLVFSPVS